MKTGIDSISLHIPNYFLSLEDLEKYRSNKKAVYDGIVQKHMSICPPDQDIVTMAYNAAAKIVDKENKSSIKLLLFCTETGLDFAKAAGLYIHEFLKLPNDCRVLELKQACYSAVGALQLAKDFVSSHKDSKVLIIASDVAKYKLNSSGEKTQGAGAVAMIVSENPKVLEIEDYSGVYSKNIMDFWRPNYLEHALVSPSYSVKSYIDVLEKCWKQYKKNSSLDLKDIDYFCYHTPFAPMIQRVHKVFTNAINKQKLNCEQILEQTKDSLRYNCEIGNCYTASMFISFISLLQNSKPKKGRVGFFSYGSGCVAEYFSGIIQDGFLDFVKFSEDNIEKRIKLTPQKYEEFYNFKYPQDGSELVLPVYSERAGELRLSRIANHKRHYILS